MSNNDDFDFNRDDLFGDDDFDNDSGGDDFTGDDFDFGDDSDDFSLDDDDFSSDLDSALGGDDDDFGGDGDDEFATTESAGGGGTSRGFIIAAVLLFLAFIGGIVVIVIILLQPDQAQIEFEQTRAAIETQNAINLTLVSASETVAVENATATAAADIANATGTQQAILDATASFVPPTETPTTDFAATDAQGTADALSTQSAIETQIAIDATNTEISFQLTLNPSFESPTPEIIATETPEEAPLGGTPVSLSAVQQTATALALLFAATPTQSGDVATSVVDGTPVVIGGATEDPGRGGGGDEELPETGLFDDVFQGNPTFIFLAAFGLLGVIVFSRSVRNRKRGE